MKLARSMLVGAASLALAAGAAYAADKPKSSFDALDKNNDGVISKVEAAASPRLAKRFDAVDKNNDGKLNRAEYRAGTAKKPVNRDAGFNKLDRNNDGYITRAEARGNPGMPKNFNAADRNDDGKLNRAEYLAAMTKKDRNTAKRKIDNADDREPRASAGRSAATPP